MRRQVTTDGAIAVLASAQAGVVSRSQLLLLGLSPRAISWRVRVGRLHSIHRGVYSVGHRVLGVEGRWMAAVLVCGADAVLSHASAAAAWDLRPAAAAIDVTVPLRCRVRRPGIRSHRSGTLTADLVTAHRGIPVTTPARTLLDLAAIGVRGRPLERLLDRAELLRLVDFADVRAALDRHPGRPGAAALGALLSRYAAGSTVTRSELEERFLGLCDRYALPRPDVNRRIDGGIEVDFLWPGARLVVEVDGYAFHRSPTAFEEDRARDVALVLAGYRVLRFTWTQVTRRPAEVARALRRAKVVS
ncbi:MAG: hypothetical protein QOF17_27 [Solirubrobacteraceae bacterium]|nr:hypothetical protein [Solirubrobacteraceae bacterium]